MCKKHLLVINTHNRINEFSTLLSHIKSYDQIFEKIIIICDSDKNYYDLVQNCIKKFYEGNKFKIDLIHLNNVGGADARNYIFKNEIFKLYNFLSFCDDDDIPYLNKFVYAENYLKKNNDCLAYSCSYFRDYGSFGKKIHFKKKKVFFDNILLNNDIGGFSFVTLNTKYLTKNLEIPVNLNSNQDWFLWIKLLFINKKKYFFKDSYIGLVYNDSRSNDRLTNDLKNIESTFFFYKVCKINFDIEIESVLTYFYYKIFKNKNLSFFLFYVLFRENTFRFKKRHIKSLLKNYFIKIF